jgi:hypothetical protein
MGTNALLFHRADYCKAIRPAGGKPFSIKTWPDNLAVAHHFAVMLHGGVLRRPALGRENVLAPRVGMN